MISMSALGVAIPRLLFFWKQCNTKTASVKFNRIDGAVSAAHIVFNYLQYTGTAKAAQHFCGIVFISGLRE